MSIRKTMEDRSAFRTACRRHADELIVIILDHLDKVPEDQQVQVVSMMMSEMNIASRKSEGKRPAATSTPGDPI